MPSNTYELCFFYSYKSELDAITSALRFCLNENNHKLISYCRVAKPYQDKTSGGRRTEGCRLIRVVFDNPQDQTNCETMDCVWALKPIEMNTGIKRRIPRALPIVKLANLEKPDLGLEQMPLQFPLFVPNPVRQIQVVRGNANDLVRAIDELMIELKKDAVIDSDENKEHIYQWFKFSAREIFHCEVSCLCDCGNCIKEETPDMKKRLSVVQRYFKSHIGIEDLSDMEDQMKEEMETELKEEHQ
jgi:hypothetical protein